MAIRPKPQEQTSGIATERQIDELIEKGGSVAGIGRPAEKPSRDIQLVQLRLDARLIERIDRQRQERAVPPSRHAWLLEAILEKLKKDG